MEKLREKLKRTTYNAREKKMKRRNESRQHGYVKKKKKDTVEEQNSKLILQKTQDEDESSEICSIIEIPDSGDIFQRDDHIENTERAQQNKLEEILEKKKRTFDDKRDNDFGIIHEEYIATGPMDHSFTLSDD